MTYKACCLICLIGSCSSVVSFIFLPKEEKKEVIARTPKGLFVAGIAAAITSILLLVFT